MNVAQVPTFRPSHFIPVQLCGFVYFALKSWQHSRLTIGMFCRTAVLTGDVKSMVALFPGGMTVQHSRNTRTSPAGPPLLLALLLPLPLPRRIIRHWYLPELSPAWKLTTSGTTLASRITPSQRSIVTTHVAILSLLFSCSHYFVFLHFCIFYHCDISCSCLHSTEMKWKCNFICRVLYKDCFSFSAFSSFISSAAIVHCV